MTQPEVSVVTPFHNVAAYLAQCIESVLTQSYRDFEYIIVDNASTDGSWEIAEAYAQRDSRIRLVRRSSLLSQVQNYNAALAEIATTSKYCKIVQADDYIFPDCLRLMVKAFEQSESIGLVSAYDLKANIVRGSGFSFPTSVIPGKEMVRLCLRTNIFVFGSPTTVMYRASLVRNHHPFYDESQLHEDTEKCMQILKVWDFAFVHQVLSFLRTENESISSAFRSFCPDDLDRYIMVQRHALEFHDSHEAQELKRKARSYYYEVLSTQAYRLRPLEFWRYHQKGLQTIGEEISWPLLGLKMGLKLLWKIANPGATAWRLIDSLKKKHQQRREIITFQY